MLNETAIAVARSVSALQLIYKDMQSDLERDPTSFFLNVFAKAGIDVPDNFHAHTSERGDGLPDEPDRANEDREVYFFRSNGILEHLRIPGTSDGNPEVLINKSGDKCNCGLCIVVEL